MIDYTDDKQKEEYMSRMVEDDDKCLIYGELDNRYKNHVRARFKGERKIAHRIAMGFALGEELHRGDVIKKICGKNNCCNPECMLIEKGSYGMGFKREFVVEKYERDTSNEIT